MAIDTKYFPAIQALVQELVAGNYHALEKDGRIGRLTAGELQKVIADYGCQLMELNEEWLGLADSYPVKGKKGVWTIDLPLWTLEEGRSDLTLSFTLIDKHNKITLKIDDLHVL